MKIRRSFVSNSSSSSFIVMYNDDSKLSLCVSGKSDEVMSFTMDDLMDILDRQSLNDDGTEVQANGVENVIDYLSEDDYSSDYYDLIEKNRYTDKEAREEVRKRISKMVSDGLSKGGFSNVMLVKISYDDKFARKILESFVKAGQMKDLQYGWCDSIIEEGQDQ